jgi:hypothetical protein
MKTTIATLLLTLAMAAPLLAGPALAYDHDGHDRGRWHGVQEWREHRRYPVYAYNRGYWGPRYWHERIVPQAGWHWRLVDGHWRWVRW